MLSDDVNYYRARAIEERELVETAGREQIREIHEELARQYEALVDRAELRPVLGIRVPPGKLRS